MNSGNAGGRPGTYSIEQVAAALRDERECTSSPLGGHAAAGYLNDDCVVNVLDMLILLGNWS